MTNTDILALLQIDLGYVQLTPEREMQLTQYIDAAIGFIETEGLVFTNPYTVTEGQLIEMYAAYLFRKRDTSEAMPRSLRWALNNAIFKQRSGNNAAE